jgi:hypothetical protein
MINCEFVGNSAPFGGAIYNLSGWETLVNCTFSANSSDFSGGALRESGFATTTISNCVLWNNSPDEIKVGAEATVALYNCDVMGGWSGDGANNMSVDPLFADPANDDYRLAAGSPCVNKGDDAALPGDVDTDLDGLPRFVGPVDLGPYEVQGGGDLCPADIDDDGMVGVNDFLDLLAYWGAAGGPADIDGDGLVGVNDFLDLLAYWGPCP